MTAPTTSGSEPVLSLRGVTRIHGSGPAAVTALADVDLQVAAGEMVAVMGRSGSGKSTLLNLAGGLDTPTTGSVTVEGTDLAALGGRQLAVLRRRHVGYVFQHGNLLPTLTVAENVALPLELDGVRPAEARRQALDALADVLDAVGDEAASTAAAIADRHPDELSGGQQQRVAIARGLVGDRRLILADEPTGALDDLTADAVMQALRARCAGGAAVLLVTHDAAQAAWADRVIRLRDGRVDMQVGTTPQHPQVVTR